MEALATEEQGTCKSCVSLFKMLNEKVKLQHNEIFLYLQYCKLLRDNGKGAEDWMVQLRIKVNQYIHWEHNRW